jgi:hypothetical protein
MKDSNGFAYFEGTWDNDQPNGYGVTKFGANGDRHEGNYKDGLRDGLGIFLWSNGDKFTGSFLRGNHYNALSLQRNNCKSTYVSKQSGEIHGSGTIKFRNGDVFSGVWENVSFRQR